MKAQVRPPSHEHEFEAAPGLPEALPRGEKLLWQGGPQWRVLARDAMHVHWIAVYFALMLGWRMVTVIGEGGSTGAALASVMLLLPLALLALGMLLLLAWLVSRTTVYTITDQRVVMRIGIVLTITFNLPYRKIESASLRRNGDGSGDIALVLAPSDRIAYLHLWPHVRPWQLKRTQPMLRAVADSAQVSALLVDAIVAMPDSESTTSRSVPARPGHLPAVLPGSGSSPRGPLAA
jgi:hypothetical protein